MNFFAKLLGLFKPTQIPATPAALVSDAEFLAVVDKRWRERYQVQPTPSTSAMPEPSSTQVAA